MVSAMQTPWILFFLSYTSIFALSNASPSTVFDRPHFFLVFELLRELLLILIPNLQNLLFTQFCLFSWLHFIWSDAMAQIFCAQLHVSGEALRLRGQQPLTAISLTVTLGGLRRSAFSRLDLGLYRSTFLG